MRWIAVFLLVLTAQGAEFDHSRWDRVLKRFVNDRGEVDYAGIRKDPAEIQGYLDQVRTASPVNKPELFPTRHDAIAYWINVYNAFVTWGVARRYPTRSVRDLGLLSGFFRSKDYVAGGVTMSPDNVEHDTLRKQFHEPRIHFAIVCASLGCPYLSREAFTGRDLDRELEAAARLFVSQDRNVAVDPAHGEVVLSKIFDWYKDDFGGTDGVLRFISGHAGAAKAKMLAGLHNPKVRYRDYDWGINDPGSRK